MPAILGFVCLLVSVAPVSALYFRLPFKERFAQSSDIFLGVLTKADGLAEGGQTIRGHFQVLASWKGEWAHDLVVRMGSPEVEDATPVILRGVYLVYANRSSKGDLYLQGEQETNLAMWAREDSIALGRPRVDRLGGKRWEAFGPPKLCPVHGTPISLDVSWVAHDLSPMRRRQYLRTAATRFPFAAMPPVDRRGSIRLNQAYVCPKCREAAEAWVGR